MFLSKGPKYSELTHNRSDPRQFCDWQVVGHRQVPGRNIVKAVVLKSGAVFQHSLRQNELSCKTWLAGKDQLIPSAGVSKARSAATMSAMKHLNLILLFFSTLLVSDNTVDVMYRVSYTQ